MSSTASCWCAFCGRADDGGTLPGGLYRAATNSAIAICVYCARAAIRAFGEMPDAQPGVVPLRPPASRPGGQRDLEEIDQTVKRLRPLLAARPPAIQGAVLADCLAIWLAGHGVAGDAAATRELRAAILANHLARVAELTAINAKMMGTEAMTTDSVTAYVDALEAMLAAVPALRDPEVLLRVASQHEACADWCTAAGRFLRAEIFLAAAVEIRARAGAARQPV